MRTTQQFSITLPTEMANVVKSKVAGGDYATESEVIRDGLRALMARDRAVAEPSPLSKFAHDLPSKTKVPRKNCATLPRSLCTRGGC
jgi:putative addiction module CopG family antidote